MILSLSHRGVTEQQPLTYLLYWIYEKVKANTRINSFVHFSQLSDGSVEVVEKLPTVHKVCKADTGEDTSHSLTRVTSQNVKLWILLTSLSFKHSAREYKLFIQSLLLWRHKVMGGRKLKLQTQKQENSFRREKKQNLWRIWTFKQRIWRLFQHVRDQENRFISVDTNYISKNLQNQLMNNQEKQGFLSQEKLESEYRTDPVENDKKWRQNSISIFVV